MPSFYDYAASAAAAGAVGAAGAAAAILLNFNGIFLPPTAECIKQSQAHRRITHECAKGTRRPQYVYPCAQLSTFYPTLPYTT